MWFLSFFITHTVYHTAHSQQFKTKYILCMFSHHIYPVPHLLLLKSTLYPSFLLSSFVFFPLRDMLLLYVWCCLESHLFYPHPLLYYFLIPFISAFLFSTSCTLWLVLLFLLLLWFLFLSFLAFSIWTLLLPFLPIDLVFLLSLSICFILYLSHSLLYSTCSVVEFVVRSFYLLYFTFCVGQ